MKGRKEKKQQRECQEQKSVCCQCYVCPDVCCLDHVLCCG